ncbi:MAG: MBL fold metallo-hydrolase [Candidatus Omnitrophica bacterium]|nr:MBL fold metallo-hydrolase [Candidatus Omnitrophota bacterium]
MKISWLGHAAFLLETTSGTKIITDPYQTGSYSGAVKYDPINIKPNIVTVSHQHFDHNYIDKMRGANIVDKEGVYKILDVEIEGILSYHDNKKGAERGKNIIFIIKADNLKVVHFGDLGTTDLNYEKLKDIDVAFLPVGGTFTIDASYATAILEKINPRITIPMHFKTKKLLFDIDPVDIFLKDKDFDERTTIEVNISNINSFKKIVLLQHLR